MENPESKIKYYQSRLGRITGTNYTEVRKKAWSLYHDIDVQTGNRNCYVRAAYFDKQKVFLKTFWNHLYDKRLGHRIQRMPYYAAGIDLLKNSRADPEVYYRDSEKCYRFYGITRDGHKFIVQVKENRKGEKYHMSTFPPGHQE
ncbi:MAG: hypothetical protein LBL08_02315 [Candidatus Nomurabacteria bacterium]|jgi:hypothetical protein|nr:hypothetical protein [Candidatus Nomurabacteria bacterium]